MRIDLPQPIFALTGQPSRPSAKPSKPSPSGPPTSLSPAKPMAWRLDVPV